MDESAIAPRPVVWLPLIIKIRPAAESLQHPVSSKIHAAFPNPVESGDPGQSRGRLGPENWRNWGAITLGAIRWADRLRPRPDPLVFVGHPIGAAASGEPREKRGVDRFRVQVRIDHLNVQVGSVLLARRRGTDYHRRSFGSLVAVANAASARA